VGIKFYLGYIEGSKVTQAKGQISTVQGALDAYYSEKAEYPNDKDKLLNAGIKTDETGSPPFDLNDEDPWGEAYAYELSGTKYRVKTGGKSTGGHNVQGQTDYRVYGKGEKGESSSPEVGVPGTL